jgi:hypothetical protein
MAIKEKLDAEWARAQQASAVSRVRATMQEGYNHILQTVSKIDAIPEDSRT